MATAVMFPGSTLRLDRQRMKRMDVFWLTIIVVGFFTYVLGLATALLMGA